MATKPGQERRLAPDASDRLHAADRSRQFNLTTPRAEGTLTLILLAYLAKL